jgi:ankyrin repeat protein
MKTYPFGVGAALILWLAISSNTWADTLHEAAKTNNLERAIVLIEQGAPINGKDETGRTAVYWAAQEDHLSMVELLAGRGADINAVSENDRGWTPLIISAFHGNNDLVDFLLGRGADINAKDRDDFTALSWAWKENRFDTVRLLLQRGANINVSPASSLGRPTIKKDLLLYAISSGADESLIKLLIDHGSNVNSNQDGVTPLHQAVDSGRIETVKLLVDAGADIQAKGRAIGGGIYTGRSFIFYSDIMPLELAKLYEKYVPGPRKEILDYLRSHAQR